MIQKAAFEKMKSLSPENVVSAMKIIDLDGEVFVEEIKLALVFEINGGNIHMTMTLIN